MARASAALMFVVALLVTSGAAEAGVVRTDGRNVIFFEAAPGERNALVIEMSASAIVLADRAPIRLARSRRGCTQRTPSSVRCEYLPRWILDVSVELGGGNDSARVSRGAANLEWARLDVASGPGDDAVYVGPGLHTINLDGGGGDDVLAGGGKVRTNTRGGSGRDRIRGGAGDDHLEGDDGSDALSGGPGDDFLTGGSGRDTLTGGRGEDSAVHEGSSDAPDSVTLDGRANDGAPGERDAIRGDVEGAIVSSPVSGNRVIGNDGPNFLDLSAVGSNTVRAGPGDDRLVAGGSGHFHGGPGDDYLKKESRTAVSARFFGDAGDDRIEVSDLFCEDFGGGPECSGGFAPDFVTCGTGRDTVRAEEGDEVARDCERVRGQ